EIAGLKFFVLGKDPAFAADEFGAVGGRISGGEHHHFHTVRILVFDVILLRSIVDAFRAALDFGGMNFGGSGVIRAESPLGDIDEMGTPVGDVTGGVVIDPAEVEVTTGRCVGLVGGASEPLLVIEVS